MPPGGARPGAGRPKGSRDNADKKQIQHLSALAREHTDEALQTLVGVMRHSESDRARITAAGYILDRGYGKAQQFIHLEGALETTATIDPSKLSDKALEELMDAMPEDHE